MPLTRSFTQSGWRDLNSRPLDPQEDAHRYRPCPMVLADALLSVNRAVGTVFPDLSCQVVISSPAAQPPARKEV
jgi:hypothetical protein